MIPSTFIKFAFSLPGMTIWMFALQCLLAVAVMRWSIGLSIFYASSMSVYLAYQTSKKMEDSFFMQKIEEEGGYATIRRFKKYLEYGQLPPDPVEYTEFKRYLADMKQTFEKSSASNQKIVFIFVITVGLFLVVTSNALGGIIGIGLAIMYSFMLRTNLRSRKHIDGLIEQLHNNGSVSLAPKERKGIE